MEFEVLRLLVDQEPRPAALQMAIDQVLLEVSETPVLRVYRWREACITIGYFERWDEASRKHPDFRITRRWTGGGSVKHGSDWPYSLIVPRSHSFAQTRPVESYRRIHAALAAVLIARAPEISLASEASPKKSAECFENPVVYDLLSGSAKVAGAGQRRGKSGLLHQGSVQIPRELHPDHMKFAEVLSKKVEPLSIAPDWLRRAEKVAQERYATPKWNRGSQAC